MPVERPENNAMSEISFKQGDQGEEIGDIQRKLACLEFYTGPQTKLFDARLRAALTAFQLKHDLPASGVCDTTTWTRLDEEAGSLFSETFQYELDALRRTPPPVGVRPAAESKVIERAHASTLAGLAFSGGGIRSATFSLGILQALAENKLLRDFDYLSTVSGGGYIGGWFSKWLKEQGGDITKAEAQLTPGSKAAPVTDEPDQIKFLRQYSNYLTPKTGMFSADTWAVIATYVRNTILNLSILITLLAAFLVLPRVLAWLVFRYHASHGEAFLIVGLLASLWVVYFIAFSISLTPDPASKGSIFSQSQGSIIRLIVVPLMLAGFASSIGLWEVRGDVRQAWDAFVAGFHKQNGTAAFAYLWSEKTRLFEFALLPGIVYFLVWLAGWATAQYRNDAPGPASVNWKNLGREGLGHLLFAILALGLGSLLVLVSLVWIGTWTAKSAVSGHYSHLVSVGMPFLLCIFGVTMVLLVGLIGRLYTDGSREWWSREGGWTIILVLSWLGLFFVAFYVPPLLFWIDAHASSWVGAIIATGWAGTTLAGVMAGAGKATGKHDGKPWLEFVAQLAPYVFTAGIIVALSTLVHVVVIADGANGMNLGPDATLPQYLDRYLNEVENTDSSDLLAALAGFLIVGMLLAWRVDINKFSLYMMYRNRLVRAYLGASSRNRRPHPFTAFDPNDDPRLEELFKPDERHVQKPYHIINAALNLVKGKELAWQTRKASGFVFSPAFCGYEMPSMPFPGGPQAAQHAARGCFRPTALYGAKHNRVNDEDEGTKLGMAVAVSGAAVSPSMGYHSSPPLAFLMTIFNVRLGKWCPNPRSSKKWKHSGPRIGLFCLIAELFGLTDADADYVYLSDGGHFENLAIYELVRRRCRLIVVVDAGADGKMNFADLGNAIRKCYTDLRIEIDIDVNRIDPLRETGFSQAHCVTGKILYGKVDAGAPDGTLLYIKPSLTGTELADVLNYRKTDPNFPHQTTVDQWFDETQFESYRSLGYRIGTVAFGDPAGKSEIGVPNVVRHDVVQLCAAIEEKWSTGQRTPATVEGIPAG
jgi:peptidoglycan hydrolase-like protein with peptidoglycan-binding domain